MLLLSIAGFPAQAQDGDPVGMARALESVLVETIAHAEGTVVAISRVEPAPAQRPGDPLDPLAPPISETSGAASITAAQFGSGVIVAHPEQPQDRFVLTTCHVAFGDRQPDRSRTLQVMLHLPGVGTAAVSATPYAADRRIDLAVLRLELASANVSAEQVPMLPLGDADGLQRGRFVIALGNPYALARDGVSSASIGIVSNLGRRPQRPATEGLRPDSTSIHEYGTLLTVDTRLQLGASGGALLNLDGQLVGITTALAALQGYEKSAGYAIPFDSGTRRIVRHLLNGQEADYGFLGISPDPWSAESDGRLVACVKASHVSADSPAAQAGLQHNDLILQINGQPVHDVPDLMRIIGLLGSGADAQLQVGRDGETHMLTARLGKWPVYDDRDILSTNPRFPVWRGLTVDYPTARQRFLSTDRLERYRRAVVVMQVEAGSPAAAIGLKSGDFIAEVDGVPIQSPSEFAAAVEGKTDAVELKLYDAESKIRLGP